MALILSRVEIMPLDSCNLVMKQNQTELLLFAQIITPFHKSYKTPQNSVTLLADVILPYTYILVLGSKARNKIRDSEKRNTVRYLSHCHDVIQHIGMTS